MKYLFSFLIIGVAGFKLAQSFMNPDDLSVFLGMDMNVWVYRLIWVAAGVFSGISIIKTRDKDLKK